MTEHSKPNLELDYVDLPSLLDSIIEKKWLILTISIILSIFSLSYILLKPPLYRASILLQIKQKLAENSSNLPVNKQPGLDTISNESISAQLALLRSKLILIPVLQTLKINSTLPKNKISELQLKNILANLKIADLNNSLDSRKSIGIFELSYTNKNPTMAVNILNQIAFIAIQKNITRKTQLVDESLKFLSRELSIVKKELEFAELKLINYKKKNQHEDYKLQKYLLINELNELNKESQLIHVQRSNLMQGYTEKYPFILSLNHKINLLKKKQNNLYKQLKKLPPLDQKLSIIQHDIDIKTTLYKILLNRVSELKVQRSSILSDIKILLPTNATELPRSQHIMLIAFCTLILGLMISSAVIIISKLINRRIDDPYWLEKIWHIRTIAIFPLCHSITSRGILWPDHFSPSENLSTQLTDKKNMTEDEVLENFYCLRTYLMQLKQSENIIINLMSLLPGMGKKFILSNLAIFLARMGQKVLLIDADLHQNQLHQVLNKNSSPGLSDLLMGKNNLDEIIQTTSSSMLSFISAGNLHPLPNDLLAQPELHQLLLQLKKHYSFILINPPSRICSETILLAKEANINLILLANQAHKISMLHQTMQYLTQFNISVMGSLFNYFHSGKKSRHTPFSMNKKRGLIIPMIKNKVTNMKSP